jgi:hypothetical protein
MAEISTSPISEVLISHIRRGYALRRIARLAKVDRTALQRFIRRERGLNLESADRVAAVLGLRLGAIPEDPPSARAVPVEQSA